MKAVTLSDRLLAGMIKEQYSEEKRVSWLVHGLVSGEGHVHTFTAPVLVLVRVAHSEVELGSELVYLEEFGLVFLVHASSLWWELFRFRDDRRYRLTSSPGRIFSWGQI